MRTILLTFTLLTFGFNALAQGQPHAKIFSNFNYDLSADDNAFKTFEISRAYLGYGYKFDNKFSAKVTFDVGSNSSGSAYTAFLKVASLNWKASDKLSVNFGQIGTKNFKFMEKAWGYRYIYKSFQDKQKWASSADAGVSADYKINSKLTLDAQVLNGEGYKKEQSWEAKTSHNFGDKKYLTFDYLTHIPIQKKLIAFSLMSGAEVRWLNEYHAAARE